MKRPAIPRKVREDVLFDSGCVYCGSSWPTQIDHVMPISRGGTSDRENLAPACSFCNWEKLDFTPEEWKAWRIETGRPWPPPNTTEIRMTLLSAAVSSLSDDEVNALEGVGRQCAEAVANTLRRHTETIYAGRSKHDHAAASLAALLRDVVRDAHQATTRASAAQRFLARSAAIERTYRTEIEREERTESFLAGEPSPSRKEPR